MNQILRQQQIEAGLQDIAAVVQHAINLVFGKMGWALIVFEFGAPCIGNYISNAQRKEMIETLRETADRLERNQDIPPAGTTIQ